MKTELEILGVAVFNREDAAPPTELTVSYKGWWHMTRLHLHLALEPLSDGVDITRKAGNMTLIQRFPSGKAPTFRVKGRSRQLEFRLYAGSSLRTRAKVTVGDLAASTTERVVKVPFEEKVGGKVAKAFLSVAQIAPVATFSEKPTSPPASEDCASGDDQTVILEANSVSEDDAMVLNATKAFDPVIHPSTHSGHHRQENEEKGTHQSPQNTPPDCDAHFVELWNKVFLDKNNPRYQEKKEEKGTRQSLRISPAACGAHPVQLWKWNMGLSALWNYALVLLRL